MFPGRTTSSPAGSRGEKRHNARNRKSRGRSGVAHGSALYAFRFSVPHFICCMKWTPKTGQSNKLLLAVQERGDHPKETEVPHGGGEGPSGAGGGEGRQDHQRAGGTAWRASDVDPCVEEATPRQRGGVVPVRGDKSSSTEHEALQSQLYERNRSARAGVGLAQKKSCHSSVRRKRVWVDAADPTLSVSQQCELLGLSRSSFYYEPATETAANLALMAMIDREYTAHPFRGSRGMRAWLRREGHQVNRKRVQHLMRLDGSGSGVSQAAICRSAARDTRCMPFLLLRNVAIERAERGVEHGYHVYSHAKWVHVPDGGDRLVQPICVVVAAVEHAGCGVLPGGVGGGAWPRLPEVFNTDQGVQFTSASFTSRLGVGGGQGEHGRQGPLPGQRVRGAIVADGEV